MESAARALRETLDRLWCPRGTMAHDMACFPVFHQVRWRLLDGPPLDYLPLASALEAKRAAVCEMPAARVPQLLVKNEGPGFVLGIDGDELVGGHQNRVLNSSVLVEPGSATVVPVSCVERGRWRASRDPGFTPGERLSHGLRVGAHAQVTDSLRSHHGHAADQQALWSGIARGHSRHGVHSGTEAMHDVYQAERERLRRYAEAFPYPRHAVGLLVALGGRFVGGDVFDRASTCEHYWDHLIRGYALDSRGSPGVPPATSAEPLLQAARRSRVEAFPSPGAGLDLRLRGSGLTGSALVYGSVAVHIGLFVPEVSS